MTIQNVTLNGVTNFGAYGYNYSWSGADIETVYFQNSGSVTNDTLNLGLSGAAWRIRRLALDSQAQTARLDVNIQDSNDGVMRRIDWLQLGDYSHTTVTLFGSRIRFIDGGIGAELTLTLGTQGLNYASLWDNAKNTITAGSGTINYIGMGDGVNKLTAGSGSINRMDMGDGTNTLILGTGDANSVAMGNGTNTVQGGGGWLGELEMGHGTNSFTGGAGNFGTIRAWGTNTMTFQNGGDSIVLGSGNSTLTLNGGYFGAITGYDEATTKVSLTINTGAQVRSVGFSGGAETLTLAGEIEQALLGGGDDKVFVTGSGRIDQLDLADGNNLLNMQGASIWSVWATSGNDTFQLVSGQSDQVYAGSGDNLITIGAGYSVGMVRMNEGNDTLTCASANVEMIELGSGNNRLTLLDGAQVSAVKADDGNDTVILQGSARILMLKLDGGNNQVTTAAGNVESLYSYGGNNILNIGAGGAQQIVLSGDGVQKVTATGFIGALQVYDNSTTTAVLNASGISVWTGKGNDVITVGAGTWHASVQTWEGNDLLTMGVGSMIQLADLGAGDDRLKLNTVFAGETAILQGGLGTDTLDLSQLTTGVTLSLNLLGGAQILGTGAIGVSGFENLVGTGQADRLTGDQNNNRIEGAVGADVLIGLGGNDTLAGGYGADTVTGGAGADEFLFVGNFRDKVTDFTPGSDVLHFTGARALADLTFTAQGANTLVAFGAMEAMIVGQGVAALQLAANFHFD